jgi:hypothetical protein
MSEHIDRIRAFAHWIADGKGHATQEAVDAMTLLADYDALAARLTEAVALLREVEEFGCDGLDWPELREFLRIPVSADEVQK